MTLQQKQLIIKQQILQCIDDPIYFLRNFCYIVHPTRGKVKFDLYDFQLKTLKDVISHKNTIILKSRQLGISTLTSGYALWLMLFHKDKIVVVIANKLRVAKKIILKVKVMYDNIPS